MLISGIIATFCSNKGFSSSKCSFAGITLLPQVVSLICPWSHSHELCMLKVHKCVCVCWIRAKIRTLNSLWKQVYLCITEELRVIGLIFGLSFIFNLKIISQLCKLTRNKNRWCKSVLFVIGVGGGIYSLWKAVLSV